MFSLSRVSIFDRPSSIKKLQPKARLVCNKAFHRPATLAQIATLIVDDRLVLVDLPVGEYAFLQVLVNYMGLGSSCGIDGIIQEGCYAGISVKSCSTFTCGIVGRLVLLTFQHFT